MASASTSLTDYPTGRSRKIAITLAFTGALFTPLSLPWLHKFYLKQYFWGLVYLVLSPTLIPRAACFIEALWYLTQTDDAFTQRFPSAHSFVFPVFSDTIQRNEDIGEAAVQTATAIREIEQLRQDGLITELEFEQKRRKLLDQV